MAIYTIEDENIDENVRIKKVERKEVETFVSVNELKQKHENCLSRIDALKKEADLIVDLIQEINDDEKIDLTIKEIPAKLITLTK